MITSSSIEMDSLPSYLNLEMLKQISTYGAALLTIMVIVRAATLEQDADLSALYQRESDVNHINDNLALRESYTPFSNQLLATIGKVNVQEIEQKSHAHLQTPTIAEPVANPVAEEQLPELTEIALIESNAALEEENNLSLDRESTINSNLSLLFPRQRINPKPSNTGAGSPE